MSRPRELPLRTVVVTVSSSRRENDPSDHSGPRLKEWAQGLGAAVVAHVAVADRQDEISSILRFWIDEEDVALVLTTGGTGFGPDDVTPEATLEVVDRLAPGIPEAMREASRPHTENWMLSRAVAGIRGRSVIVNFPGSPASIDQVGPAIARPLLHAVTLLRQGEVRH